MELLLGTDAGRFVADVLGDPQVDLHAPALCDVEVAAGLRRALLTGAMPPNRAQEALADHRDLPLTRHGHLELLGRVLELRQNLSAYDATYVALAEKLSAELLTADGALARAAEAHTPVRVVTA